MSRLGTTVQAERAGAEAEADLRTVETSRFAPAYHRRIETNAVSTPPISAYVGDETPFAVDGSPRA